MVNVRISAPRGVGPAGPEGFGEGFQIDLAMPQVPGIGETIALGEIDEERTYRVHGVHWYPDGRHEFDVYVVLRD
jgi:hypothetical protein